LAEAGSLGIGWGLAQEIIKSASTSTEQLACFSTDLLQ
jgi:hypothetical protein